MDIFLNADISKKTEASCQWLCILPGFRCLKSYATNFSLCSVNVFSPIVILERDKIIPTGSFPLSSDERNRVIKTDCALVPCDNQFCWEIFLVSTSFCICCSAWLL